MTELGTVHLIAVFIVFLLLASSSQADPKAMISGHVTDAGGAAIKGAHVVLWDSSGSKVGLTDNVGTPDEVRAETDVSGNYSVDIPPGFYDVFISAPAFTPVATKLCLKPGQAGCHNVKLALDPQVSQEIGGMGISGATGH